MSGFVITGHQVVPELFRLARTCGITLGLPTIHPEHLISRSGGLVLRLSEALAKFTRSSLRIFLFNAIAHHVSEFVGDPVTQPLLALITIIVDENGSASQMREHDARVAGRNAKLKHPGTV